MTYFMSARAELGCCIGCIMVRISAPALDFRLMFSDLEGESRTDFELPETMVVAKLMLYF